MTRANDLANAYRQALAAGGQEFANRPVERKILEAIVADSAAGSALWVRTRMPEGDRVVAPINDLAGALAPGNWVGKGIDQAQQQLVKQATGLVSSLVLKGTLPAWITCWTRPGESEPGPRRCTPGMSSRPCER